MKRSDENLVRPNLAALSFLTVVFNHVASQTAYARGGPASLYILQQYAPLFFALFLGATSLIVCAVSNVVLGMCRRGPLVGWGKLLIATLLWALLAMYIDARFAQDLPQ